MNFSLSFSLDNYDLKGEEVLAAHPIKIYHHYEQRNAWINWDGDTMLTNRHHPSFSINLESAKQKVEKSRTKGTRFIIDELPGICIRGKKFSLLLVELLNGSPFYLSDEIFLNGVSNLTDIVKNIQLRNKPGKPWNIVAIFEGNFALLELINTDTIFYSRTSGLAKNKHGLPWSLSIIQIDIGPIMKTINCLAIAK